MTRCCNSTGCAKSTGWTRRRCKLPSPAQNPPLRDHWVRPNRHRLLGTPLTRTCPALNKPPHPRCRGSLTNSNSTLSTTLPGKLLSAGNKSSKPFSARHAASPWASRRYAPSKSPARHACSKPPTRTESEVHVRASSSSGYARGLSATMAVRLKQLTSPTSGTPNALHERGGDSPQ